ncbi:MAG: hypothetical protein Kow0031_34270 [Anaerolineae bacterium]
MMLLKIAGVALLSAVIGYVVGLGGGILLVNLFSGNSHDKALEAAMTGAFVVGPCVALIAAGAGAAIYWRRAGI